MISGVLTHASFGYKFRDKIFKGALSEAEYYDLIGYARPAEDDHANFGSSSRFREMFSQYVRARPEEIARVQKHADGQEDLNVMERLDLYVAAFTESLQRHFHPGQDGEALSCKELLRRASEKRGS